MINNNINDNVKLIDNLFVLINSVLLDNYK